MLATRFALMYPDLVGKLVLVNPIGLEDWKTVVPYIPIDKFYQAELQQTPEKVKTYFQKSYFDGQWKPEYDDLLTIQAGWIAGPDYKRVAWNSALTYDMIFTQPVVYEFPNLKVPTLLIIGQRDRTVVGKASAPPEVAAKLGNYPVLGRKSAEAIPRAELVELEGVGHLPQVEAFDEYMGALQGFLGK
jgi:pimeloyl-ACP methyl ester carboxylesterase